MFSVQQLWNVQALPASVLTGVAAAPPPLLRPDSSAFPRRRSPAPGPNWEHFFCFLVFARRGGGGVWCFGAAVAKETPVSQIVERKSEDV